MERYHTIKELAALWNCDPQTVRRLIKTGELHSVKIGHLYRIPDSSREAYEKGETA